MNRNEELRVNSRNIRMAYMESRFKTSPILTSKGSNESPFNSVKFCRTTFFLNNSGWTAVLKNYQKRLCHQFLRKNVMVAFSRLWSSSVCHLQKWLYEAFPGCITLVWLTSVQLSWEEWSRSKRLICVKSNFMLRDDFQKSAPFFSVTLGVVMWGDNE